MIIDFISRHFTAPVKARQGAMATPQPQKADFKDAVTYVSTSLFSFFKPLPPPPPGPGRPRKSDFTPNFPCRQAVNIIFFTGQGP